jgi:hypothetical protein
VPNKVSALREVVREVVSCSSTNGAASTSDLPPRFFIAAGAIDPIDVDEIADVNFPDSSDQGEAQSVEVVFKDGSTKTFGGSDLPHKMNESSVRSNL